MTLPIALSAAAQRTHPSSISHLMQTALENPGMVSLAAGFVDQHSLPVELVGRTVAEVFSDRALRPPGASVRNDGWRPGAASTLARAP